MPNDRMIEVSTGGGTQPAWSRDGTELFYVGRDRALYSVKFDPATGVVDTPRRTLPSQYFHGAMSGLYAARMYDVANDGRFLMIKDAPPDRSTARAGIVVTQNWLEELKRLVPSK